MFEFKKAPVDAPEVGPTEALVSFLQNPEVIVPAALLGLVALPFLLRSAFRARRPGRQLRRLDGVMPYARADPD